MSNFANYFQISNSFVMYFLLYHLLIFILNGNCFPYFVHISIFGAPKLSEIKYRTVLLMGLTSLRFTFLNNVSRGMYGSYYLLYTIQ